MRTNRELFLASEPEIDVTQFKKTVLDVQYADQSPNQILDIFYPDQGEGPYPLIILFHGGAFMAGHKRTFYISSMVKPVTQGYAIATCEYRLVHESKWPAQLYDAKFAIRYLRAHAQELNLDPERFVVWGNSAGGCVTQLIATTADNPDMDDLSVGENVSSKVQGAIAWYSVNDFVTCEQATTDIHSRISDSGTEFVPMEETILNDSPLTKVLGYNPLYYPDKAASQSPISYVDENCAPMLLQHGTGDTIVECHQSIYMYNKVNLICGPGRAKIDLFRNEPHGSQVIKADKNIAHCIDFLDELLFDGKNPYRKELTPIVVKE